MRFNGVLFGGSVALPHLLLMLLLLLHTSLHTVLSQTGIVQADENDNCAFWASIGECAKNPNYMLRSCQTSCRKVADAENSQRDPLPDSFYSIEEINSNGDKFSFDIFRGRVVYIVNVASHCGYTQQNYELLQRLQKYESAGLSIVLAPCNAFGFQEPGDAIAINAFASRSGFQSNGYSRIILSKGEVNGDATRASFRYLKQRGNKLSIAWNFDGKFLVDRAGGVHVPQSDATLEQQIVALLQEQQQPEQLQQLPDL